MNNETQPIEQESTGRGRKVAAGALAALGVLGLGLAAASQLNLTWAGNFQAGAVEVSADCQTEAVTVSFANPEFDGTVTAPWTIDSVDFANVSPECANMAYEASYKVAGADWTAPTTGTVQGTTITVPLTGVDPQEIAEFALTIYGD